MMMMMMMMMMIIIIIITSHFEHYTPRTESANVKVQTILGVKKSSPITRLDRCRVFQEFEAPGSVSPTHRPPLPSGNIPGTHFC